MLKPVLVALFAASIAAVPVLASEHAAASAEKAEPFSIDTATCADVFDLYEDAAPGEGKDEKELEEAQDTVLWFVLWVHGYLSGRDGIDRDKRPLSKEGVETTVKDIATVCKPDESKLFLDVVGDIK